MSEASLHNADDLKAESIFVRAEKSDFLVQVKQMQPMP